MHSKLLLIYHTCSINAIFHIEILNLVNLFLFINYLKIKFIFRRIKTNDIILKFLNLF